jgi:hypothetical protein
MLCGRQGQRQRRSLSRTTVDSRSRLSQDRSAALTLSAFALSPGDDED